MHRLIDAVSNTTAQTIMSRLIAWSCPSRPDLAHIWHCIRVEGLQPFQEVAFNGNPSLKFRIFHPSLRLQPEPGVPLVVFDAYEDMFAAHLKAQKATDEQYAPGRLFSIGHPGIGQARSFALFQHDMEMFWRSLHCAL